MITSNGLIILLPLLTTIFEPSLAPINCPTPMTKPTCHNIFPPSMKNINDAMLEVKFSNLLYAVALARLKPARATKEMARNEPVPGPKNPS